MCKGSCRRRRLRDCYITMFDLIFGLSFFIFLVIPAYLIERIQAIGWFRFSHRWARKIDRRIEELFHSYYSAGFRWDCADFLEVKYRSARDKR